jgi:prophage regulatory protein
MPQIIRLPQTTARTGLSRATLYRLKKLGLFPQAVQLGPNSIGFLESEVNEWIEKRAAARARLTKPAGAA